MEAIMNHDFERCKVDIYMKEGDTFFYQDEKGNLVANEIEHNGMKIIPIMDIAKSCLKTVTWIFDDKYGYAKATDIYKNDYCFEFDYGNNLFLLNGNALNIDHISILDYMNELHIDYRGLIEKGLALDKTKVKQ